MQKRERIRWMDVAKLIGIFAIYIGHLGSAAGNTYSYVFAFHVPLFFLISGCMESLSGEIGLREYGKYVLKKVKTILLPFYLFVLLSVYVYAVLNNSGAREIVKNLVRGGTGSHPQFFSGAAALVPFLPVRHGGLL